eukprot:4295998-Alexandrium_andersonii.AAC.1
MRGKAGRWRSDGRCWRCSCWRSCVRDGNAAADAAAGAGTGAAADAAAAAAAGANVKPAAGAVAHERLRGARVRCRPGVRARCQGSRIASARRPL